MTHFAPSRLLTILRAQHISFSDFPLVMPQSLQKTDAYLIMDRIALLAERFLNGAISLEGSHVGVEGDGIPVRPATIDLGEDGKQKLVGETGDIVFH
jgi:platelet-activating factor acetylhydrolase